MVQAQQDVWMGIDLGMTNSAVEYWQNRRPEYLQNSDDGKVTIRSVGGIDIGSKAAGLAHYKNRRPKI